MVKEGDEVGEDSLWQSDKVIFVTANDDLRCQRKNGGSWQCNHWRIHENSYCEYHFLMNLNYNKQRNQKKKRGYQTDNKTNELEALDEDNMGMQPTKKKKKKAKVGLETNEKVKNQETEIVREGAKNQAMGMQHTKKEENKNKKKKAKESLGEEVVSSNYKLRSRNQKPPNADDTANLPIRKATVNATSTALSSQPISQFPSSSEGSMGGSPSGAAAQLVKGVLQGRVEVVE